MNSPSHIEKRISAIIIEKKEKKMKIRMCSEINFPNPKSEIPESEIRNYSEILIG
jgi:hypothetical protein